MCWPEEEQKEPKNFTRLDKFWELDIIIIFLGRQKVRNLHTQHFFDKIKNKRDWESLYLTPLFLKKKNPSLLSLI